MEYMESKEGVKVISYCSENDSVEKNSGIKNNFDYDTDFDSDLGRGYELVKLHKVFLFVDHRR